MRDADCAAINHGLDGGMVFGYDFRPCTCYIGDGGGGVVLLDDLQEGGCHHQVAEAAGLYDHNGPWMLPCTLYKWASYSVEQREWVAQ